MAKKTKWASVPFDACLANIQELNRILHLCIQGLSQITKLPALAKALVNIKNGVDNLPFTPEQQRELDETNMLAEFAKTEVENQFPVLHAHTVIALWGSLETLVFDLATTWITNKPSVLKKEQFSKIKVSLSEYSNLRKAERIAFLVKEISRSLNADFKLGVNKFETILETLDLSGPVEDEVKRTLFEMSQVRNVLVHRSGIVDRRFREACPCYPTKLGEKIQIDHKKYKRYMDAIEEYILCLINRVRVKLDLGIYEPEKEHKAVEEFA